jgi:hypothetical protein
MSILPADINFNVGHRLISLMETDDELLTTLKCLTCSGSLDAMEIRGSIAEIVEGKYIGLSTRDYSHMTKKQLHAFAKQSLNLSLSMSTKKPEMLNIIRAELEVDYSSGLRKRTVDRVYDTNRIINAHERCKDKKKLACLYAGFMWTRSNILISLGYPVTNEIPGVCPLSLMHSHNIITLIDGYCRFNALATGVDLDDMCRRIETMYSQ